MFLDTQTSEDRRTFQRFHTRFPAKFKDSRDEFGTQVNLRDASAEGVRFNTREHLYVNDNVALEVELSDGKLPLNIRGKVVWAKALEDSSWDAGLQFHKIDLMRLSRLFETTLA